MFAFENIGTISTDDSSPEDENNWLITTSPEWEEQRDLDNSTKKKEVPDTEKKYTDEEIKKQISDIIDNVFEDSKTTEEKISIPEEKIRGTGLWSFLKRGEK